MWSHFDLLQRIDLALTQSPARQRIPHWPIGVKARIEQQILVVFL
jgi:hypothetical protein